MCSLHRTIARTSNRRHKGVDRKYRESPKPPRTKSRGKGDATGSRKGKSLIKPKMKAAARAKRGK